MLRQGLTATGEMSIDFNDYDLMDLEHNDLTIQGGWDTSSGISTSGSQPINSIFQSSLAVKPIVGAGTHNQRISLFQAW